MRKKDDEKEKSIKEAVIKLILEQGFHGTSISKIAKEAGVSPATVYIYYENKEIMLQAIYQEYSEEIFDSLLDKLRGGLEGNEFVDRLIRSYYTYILEHEEIFHFVDQFSSCPALANNCSAMKGVNAINALFQELKAKGILKEYNNENLSALLFSPVKSIASNHCIDDEEKEQLLKEMIMIIQGALLT